MFQAALIWIARLFVAAVLLLGLANCTMLGLNYSSLETGNKPTPSPTIAADFDPASVRTTFEDELYGPWPENLPVTASNWRMVDANYLDGRGTLEEVMVTIGAGESARTFPVVIALPQASDHPVPLVLSQTFAGNCSVFPDLAVSRSIDTICDGSEMSGFLGTLFRIVGPQVFGTYIAYAPVERYLDAGLGYASFDGSSFVPDRNTAAQPAMSALSPGPHPTSTLMAWAYGYHGVADTLASDTRIRADAVAAAGHSRYGKSALIAAAWSDTISAAISHQSGFAGAASSRSPTGETLSRMAKTYPHWLRPGLHEDLDTGTDLTLDQHFLLALAAPKPLFLGNGRRDVWSDPNSTYRIAAAADKTYEARGVGGLPDSDMRSFDPSAEISFWLRTGGHSVVLEDIDAFIGFMDAHFLAPVSGATGLQSNE